MPLMALSCSAMSWECFLSLFLWDAPMSGRRGLAKAAFDVALHDLVELLRDAVTAQGQGLFAVDEDRGGRRLAIARQADADVGVLAFTRAVDDAAHDGHLEVLDAGVLLAPDGHLRTQVIVDLLGQLLEGGAGGATAARAGGDAGHEGAQSHGLQD